MLLEDATSIKKKKLRLRPPASHLHPLNNICGCDCKREWKRTWLGNEHHTYKQASKQVSREECNCFLGRARALSFYRAGEMSGMETRPTGILGE